MVLTHLRQITLRQTDVHRLVGLASSFALHGGMALAALTVHFSLGPQAASTRADRSSIALLASFSNTLDPHERDMPLGEQLTPIVTPPTERPKAPLERVPEPESLQRTPPDPSALELAALPPAVAEGASIHPLPQLRATLSETLSDALSSAESAPPPVPRAEVAHELRVERIEAARSSLASPAAEARQGAEVDTLPTVLYNPAPVYPPRALRARVTGLVRLAVRIAADGTVVEATVLDSSGTDDLDQAALRAIRLWRFRAAQRAGVAVEYLVGQTIVFELPR